MSRRVTDKESLDFYTDFLTDPGVILQTGVDNDDSIHAIHYGTGIQTVVNPFSMQNSAVAGHPGIGRLTFETPKGDNPQIWLKCGMQAKRRDFTRYTCTFRLGQVPTPDWFASAVFALQVDSEWGGMQIDVVKDTTTVRDGKVNWCIAGSDNRTGPNPEDVTLNEYIELYSADPDTRLLEWHNIDIRLDYEKGEIKYFLDGQLIAQQTSPLIAWDHAAYPGIWFYEDVDGAYLEIDEIGWSTRKESERSAEVFDLGTRTLRTGTTRRDNV
jgi:hypothetical protein